MHWSARCITVQSHCVSITVAAAHADSTLRHLQDGVTYEDGCHVWLCVPELGWVEYHPFSVASTVAHPAWRDRMLLHVKVYDRWTSVRTIYAHCCPGFLKASSLCHSTLVCVQNRSGFRRQCCRETQWHVAPAVPP